MLFQVYKKPEKFWYAVDCGSLRMGTSSKNTFFYNFDDVVEGSEISIERLDHLSPYLIKISDVVNSYNVVKISEIKQVTTGDQTIAVLIDKMQPLGKKFTVNHGKTSLLNARVFDGPSKMDFAVFSNGLIEWVLENIKQNKKRALLIDVRVIFFNKMLKLQSVGSSLIFFD